MIPKLEELLDKGFEVTLHYEGYARDTQWCVCTLKRPYVRHIEVQKLGNTDLLALSNALRLLDKVEELEKHVKIGQPDGEKQKYHKGYYREIIFENYEVEFKRMHVTDITRKDPQGFYILDNPKEVIENERYCIATPERIEHTFGEKYINKYTLEEGETLWMWNDIRCLSGSAGLLVVKDGKIIKEKGILLS